MNSLPNKILRAICVANATISEQKLKQFKEFETWK